jgi:hypothetical protein
VQTSSWGESAAEGLLPALLVRQDRGISSPRTVGAGRLVGRDQDPVGRRLAVPGDRPRSKAAWHRPLALRRIAGTRRDDPEAVAPAARTSRLVNGRSRKNGRPLVRLRVRVRRGPSDRSSRRNGPTNREGASGDGVSADQRPSNRGRATGSSRRLWRASPAEPTDRRTHRDRGGPAARAPPPIATPSPFANRNEAETRARLSERDSPRTSLLAPTRASASEGEAG